MRKPTMWILTKSDTIQAEQPLEMARADKAANNVVVVCRLHFKTGT